MTPRSPRLPVARVFKVEFNFEFSSDTFGSNITHWAYSYGGSGNPTQGEVNAVAGIFSNAFDGRVMTAVNSDITHTTTVVTPLDAPDTLVGTSTGNVAGSISGATTPASCSVLASYTIGTRWRGGRPKNYWPSMSGAQLQDPSLWHADDLSAYSTSYGEFVGDVVGNGNGAVVIGAQGMVSYVESVVSGSPPVSTPGVLRDPPVFFPFTSTTFRALIGSQRRRIRSGLVII